MAETALYRFFDVSGALLYVGITGQPGERFSLHLRKAQWWGEVATMRMEWLPSRAKAFRAEAMAIAAEKPVYNLSHNPEVIRGIRRDAGRPCYIKIVDPELHRALKEWAAIDGRTVQSIADEALRDWLAKRSKRQAKVRGVA